MGVTRYDGCLRVFEGCFKGVLRVFEGLLSVFEGCLKGILRVY